MLSFFHSGHKWKQEKACAMTVQGAGTHSARYLPINNSHPSPRWSDAVTINICQCYQNPVTVWSVDEAMSRIKKKKRKKKSRLIWRQVQFMTGQSGLHSEQRKGIDWREKLVPFLAVRWSVCLNLTHSFTNWLNPLKAYFLFSLRAYCVEKFRSFAFWRFPLKKR